jgi:hypothetical protein
MNSSLSATHLAMSSVVEERDAQNMTSLKSTSVPSAPRHWTMPKYKLPGRLVRATICSDSIVPGDGGDDEDYYDDDDDDDDVVNTIWNRFINSHELGTTKDSNGWKDEYSFLLDPSRKGTTKEVKYESFFRLEQPKSSAAAPIGESFSVKTCIIYTLFSAATVAMVLYFIWVWKHSTALQM